jgi:hypothetical protein
MNKQHVNRPLLSGFIASRIASLQQLALQRLPATNIYASANGLY